MNWLHATRGPCVGMWWKYTPVPHNTHVHTKLYSYCPLVVSTPLSHTYVHTKLYSYCPLAVVWLGVNGITHIKVIPHRAGLVLGWVTIHGYTILVFNQPTRPIQPGYRSMGRRNEYWWWSWPMLGKKRQDLCNSKPCYQDCWPLWGA